MPMAYLVPVAEQARAVCGRACYAVSSLRICELRANNACMHAAGTSIMWRRSLEMHPWNCTEIFDLSPLSRKFCVWRKDCFKIFDAVGIGGPRGSPFQFCTLEEQLLVWEKLRASSIVDNERVQSSSGRLIAPNSRCNFNDPMYDVLDRHWINNNAHTKSRVACRVRVCGKQFRVENQPQVSRVHM